MEPNRIGEQRRLKKRRFCARRGKDRDRRKSVKNNIVLIGMPGAGKSTVGVVLAKKLGCSLVDADLLIQEKYGKLLHELIAENGVEGFWTMCHCHGRKRHLRSGGYGAPKGNGDGHLSEASL